MALTSEQLKKLWLNEQTSSNPRYSFMGAADKATIDAQLNDYYDKNQQTFIDKYSGNSIETPVSTDITDDSERTPFDVKQSSKLLYSNLQNDPNTVSLLDDANNRVLWMDNNLTVLKAIWYYDVPPSLPTAGLIGTITKADVLKGVGTPDPVGLAELMFRGEFNVVQSLGKITWINKLDANDYYEFTTINGKNWTPVHKTTLDHIQKILIQSGLDDHIIDPLHPETIDNSWSLIGTGTTNPLATIKSNGKSSISNGQIVLIFMGDDWLNQDKYRMLLINYINHLLVSKWMNILTQYGVNSARVVETRNITEISNKNITDGDIRNLINNDGRIYLILLSSDIIISDKDPQQWVYNGPINGELEVTYHSELGNTPYGVIRYNSNIDYYNIISAILIGNILTAGWEPEVMSICGGLRKAINATYEINVDLGTNQSDVLFIPAIWNQHYNTCSISNDIPIVDPIISVSSLYDTYYWNIGNTLGIKIKVISQKDLYGTFGYQLIGYMDINDASIGYDEWYKKYIQPVRDLTQITIPISPPPKNVSLEDILKALPTGFTIEIISNNKTSALVDVTQNWNLIKHYYLYWNDPQKGWVLIQIFDYQPDEQTIEDTINYKPDTFKIGNKTIIWDGKEINSILTGNISYWNFQSPDPIDPNAFTPNVYYYIDRFSDPFWVNKGSPWTFRYIDPNIQNDSDVLRFNPYELFFGDYYIFSQGRDPFTWEIQDPSIINSYWSIESIAIDGICTWRFGSFISDPAYRLRVKPVSWTDHQGNTGINAIVIGYQHTDLDGIIREEVIPKQTFIIDPFLGGGSLILKGALSVPLSADIKKLYYDTYTSGHQLLQTPSQWGSDGTGQSNPFLIWGAVNSVINGISFNEAFLFIGDVIAAYSYNERFTEVRQHSADINNPQLGDYVLMEGKELTTNRKVRIYHEWVPWKIWSPIGVGKPSYEKHIGGFFMTRLYFIP